MARSPKQKSLTALARSLDTRKQPLPTKAPSAAQQRVLERAVRPEVRHRIEAALTRQPLTAKPATSKAAPSKLPAAPPARRPELAKPVVVSTGSTPRPAAPAQRPGTPPATRAPAPAAAVVNRQSPAAAQPSLARSAALLSLSRSPSAAPARTPEAKPVVAADPRRKYPRAEVQVRARLELADDPSRFFEATLPTVNLSVGGLFLASSFFLKVGTRLLVTLSLPRQSREVRVKGEVVRIESNGAGPSGFALRFTEYLDNSQVVLATHFLSPVLKQFLAQYAKEHRFDASPEYLAHTADVLAAWELRKAELGGDVWALYANGQ
jgi:Tfp pilus assembly protein PilZ